MEHSSSPPCGPQVSGLHTVAATMAWISRKADYSIFGFLDLPVRLDVHYWHSVLVTLT